MLRSLVKFSGRLLGTPTTVVGLFKDHAILYIGLPWLLEHGLGHYGEALLRLAKLSGH